MRLWSPAELIHKKNCICELQISGLVAGGWRGESLTLLYQVTRNLVSAGIIWGRAEGCFPRESSVPLSWSVVVVVVVVVVAVVVAVLVFQG